MRNRVSFSYINEYQQDYAAYSNTIFFTYDNANIYKNDIRYTYIGKNDWTYIHHDIGTTYAYTNEAAETVTLYENEYEDKYKYVITANNDYENNLKTRAYLSHNVGKNFEIRENIYSYIKVPLVSYTYAPNFIEGLTDSNGNIDHKTFKLAYSYSTNNMLASETSFPLNSYGQYLSRDEQGISYNVRGTLTNSDNEEIIITGIGFKYIPQDTTLFAGLEYENVLYAYVYGHRNNEYSNNEDTDKQLTDPRSDEQGDSANGLFAKLSVTLPGVDGSNYTTTYNNTKGYVALSIKNTNKHIGNVLVKISLDWRNNKFTLHHTLNFNNIIDEIKSIRDILYSVNYFGDKRSQLLEGDNINCTYIYTTPERANNKIKYKTTNNLISKQYIGEAERTDHSNVPFMYDIDNSYYVNKIAGNAYTDNLKYTAYFNYKANNYDYTLGSTQVFKFAPYESSITYTYAYNGAYEPFDASEMCVTYLSDKEDARNRINVKGSFNIAATSNTKSNTKNYSYKLQPGSTYNIVNVSYEYSCRYTGIGATTYNAYNNADDGLQWNDTLSYNSYNYSLYANEPGQYKLKWNTYNGEVSRTGTIKTLQYWNVNREPYRIITYEGAEGVPLLNNIDYLSSYTVLSDVLSYVDYNGVILHMPDSRWNTSYTYTCIDVPYDYNNTCYWCHGNFGQVQNPIIENKATYLWAAVIGGYDKYDKNNENALPPGSPYSYKELDYNKDNYINTGDISYAWDDMANRVVDGNNAYISYLYLNSTRKDNDYITCEPDYLISCYVCYSIAAFTNTYTYYDNSNKEYTGYEDLNRIDLLHFNKVSYVIHNTTHNTTYAIPSLTQFKLDLTKTRQYIENDTSYYVTYVNERFGNNYENFKYAGRYNLTYTIDDVLDNDNNTVSYNTNNGLYNGLLQIYEEYNNNPVNDTRKIYFKINKKNISNDISFPITAYFHTKIDRFNEYKDNEYVNKNYWDALGFSDAIHDYEIIIDRSMAKVDDPNISDMILYSNVKDINEKYSYAHQYINDVNGEFERFAISYNDTSFNVEGSGNIYYTYIKFAAGPTQGNSTSYDLLIKQYVNNGSAYIEFVPKYNKNIDTAYSLTFTYNNEHSSISKCVAVKSFNPIIEEYTLSYLRDVTDSSKILYQELLLTKDANTVNTYSDSEYRIISNDFNEYILCNDNNGSNDNNNGYINIKLYDKVNGYTYSTNVPAGVKLSFDNVTNTHMKYNFDNKVLIPTSNENVKIILKHDYNDQSWEQPVTMKDVTPDSTIKLYTNGADENYPQ